MSTPSLSTSSSRLLSTLIPALLGQGRFTPGRPDASRALAGLGESLCRWLDQHPGLVLLGDNPADPLSSRIIGLADGAIDPCDVIEDSSGKNAQLHFAGFWKDLRLVLICLRKGLTPTEFDHLFHLLTHYSGKGLQLRNRLFDEQIGGRLSHVSLIFLDDLPETGPSVDWSARVTLGWLHRDLNLLSRVKKLPTKERVDWREQLLSFAIELPKQSHSLAEFFANLDAIAEEIDDYDKDELVFALLEKLDDDLADKICLDLCAIAGRLQGDETEDKDKALKKHCDAARWITRRLAEHMMEEDLASPQHYHALVLHKILLYEEIPQRMRPRVASLQVLTSFLSNPQKYFNEVENSHSPEVLETRLWRILEMVPKLVLALRFDVARQVLDFSQRFGSTFDLHHKPEIMQALMDTAAGVLLETTREQQVALMKELPKMGRTGQRLLIALADHQNRSVRRTAIDALIKIGQPIIPVLFEVLENKQGWHYLRNMLLVLAQLNAGGPKVEKLLFQCCRHPQANVRKEALPGLARLLKERAELQVAEALADPDLEVRKRAAACLGVTGITQPGVRARLAEVLGAKDCSEDLALQVVASINRLKLSPAENTALESALHALLGSGGFLGMGGGKGTRSEALKVAVIQALGYVGTVRSKKILRKFSSEQNAALARAAEKSLARLSD